MPTTCGLSGCARVPPAPMLGGIPQTVNVTSGGSVAACPFVPRASVFVQVREHVEVAMRGGLATRVLVPWTAIPVQVAQDVEVTPLGRKAAHALVPRTPTLCAQIDQTIEVSARRCDGALAPVPGRTAFVQVA